MEQLLGLLRSRPLGFYNVPEMLRLLMRACQVRARSDPRGFSEFLLAEMAAFTGHLLLRTQLQLAGRIAACGQGMGRPGIVDLLPDMTERLLPALSEMQRGLGEVLATQAATARMWALADARRAANGDDTGTGPSVHLRERTPDSPVAGRKRRHAANGKDKSTTNGKAAGASNGKAPATKRTRQKNGYARTIAFELLQQKGGDGMHIRDLLSALEERDAAPKGASKRASLQSQLESDARFERHQPATYRIRQEQEA